MTHSTITPWMWNSTVLTQKWPLEKTFPANLFLQSHQNLFTIPPLWLFLAARPCFRGSITLCMGQVSPSSCKGGDMRTVSHTGWEGGLLSARVQPLICFPNRPLMGGQQSQRAENKQQWQKSIPPVISRSTGFNFQDLGLSLAVSGDPFSAELVQPSKPCSTPGSALPEWPQGAGWMQDMRINGVFSGYVDSM